MGADLGRGLPLSGQERVKDRNGRARADLGAFTERGFPALLQGGLQVRPHLLLSQMSAADNTLPPISSTVMDTIFLRLRLSPSQLRQDRILDEAKHTADPVHLMRVFGITARPAMRYVQAAHPERRSTQPR